MRKKIRVYKQVGQKAGHIYNFRFVDSIYRTYGKYSVDLRVNIPSTFKIHLVKLLSDGPLHY